MRTRAALSCRVRWAVPATVVLMLALGAGLGTPLRAPVAPAAQEAEIETAPVAIDGTELFRVRGASSLPAAERASRIVERLEAAAADPAVSEASVRAVEANGTTQILAGDTVVMAVIDSDAALEQLNRQELAAIHVGRIQRAITQYRASRSPEALRGAVINAAVATVVTLAAVAVLFLLWRRFDGLLTRRLRARIHTVGIQSFELMRAEQIWTVVRNGFLGLRTIVLLLIVLSYVSYLLAAFPRTRGLSNDMTALALAPLSVIADGFVRNVPSLVFLVVLFLVVRMLLRLLHLFFDSVGRGMVTLPNFFPEWAEPTYKIIRLGLVGFALVVAYPYIPGSSTAAFQGVSLFIGIVFSLGSSSAIANIIAGYMMTYRRALKLGDRVKIGDTVGDVIETRLQVTHLRTVKNEEVTIPNSQILAGEVLNYTSLAAAHGLILHTEVSINYDTPWRQVEAMLLEAAGRTAGLEAEPKPFVMMPRLGEFSVTYELNVYCRNVSAMNALYSNLRRNILDVFNEYGIQIMVPAYEGDPPEPKVVAPKDWFTLPAVQPPKAG